MCPPDTSWSHLDIVGRLFTICPRDKLIHPPGGSQGGVISMQDVVYCNRKSWVHKMGSISMGKPEFIQCDGNYLDLVKIEL